MGKATWTVAAWLSFLCIIYFLIVFTAGGFDIAFVAFCSLALFLGQDGNPKKLKTFVLSSLCGVIWGFLNLQCVNFLVEAMGGPQNLVWAAMIVIFVLTTVEIGVHQHMLANTPLNNMPYIFLGVALSFSGKVHPNWFGGWQTITGIQGEPITIHPQFMLWPIFLCGMLIGTLFVLAIPKVFGKFAPPPEDKPQAKPEKTTV